MMNVSIPAKLVISQRNCNNKQAVVSLKQLKPQIYTKHTHTHKHPHGKVTQVIVLTKCFRFKNPASARVTIMVTRCFLNNDHLYFLVPRFLKQFLQ